MQFDGAENQPRNPLDDSYHFRIDNDCYYDGSCGSVVRGQLHISTHLPCWIYFATYLHQIGFAIGSSEPSIGQGPQRSRLRS